jgi:hypothetical protein
MMRTVLISLIALFLPAAPAIATEKHVEVMVLGAYHFGNPGLDVNNVKVDSVLTPVRQAELDAVARALLAFKPTHVMVEMQSDAPDFASKSYQTFTPERLKTEANESDQIGFRVAKMAGLSVVNAIDEQPTDGEPDYFPYDKLQESAAKFHQNAIIEQANVPTKAWLRDFENAQKTASVADLLIKVNTDPLYLKMDELYSWLPIGNGASQAGADLNAAWYLRNAKIFGKLMQVAKPGNRVLVVYGGGHEYWLRHFARETPGYRSIDPVPYLKRAKVRR